MSSQEYLSALEREARRSLMPDQVASIVEEARAHLEASIQARVELGMELEVAERESLAAFGSFRAVVQPRVDDRRVRWLALSFGGMYFQYLSIHYGFIARTWLSFTVFILLQDALIIGAALAFAGACFRVRRPAKATLALTVLLAIAVPTGYLQGLESGGFGNGFRRTFVESPIQALDRMTGEHPLEARAFMEARRAIEWIDDSRHELALLIGGPVGIDLGLGTLGALTFAVRRRPRGGLHV